MSEGKLVEEFVVPSYLTDSSRLLSPASTLAVMQDISYKGAESLGIGDSAISTRGLAWVLCRARFIVRRAPSMFERVRLETWHKGVLGPYFIRNYRILDRKGEELVKATSSCALIDTQSRMLARPDHVEGFNCMEPQCEDSTFEQQADKIIVPRCEPSEKTVEHEIRYTDIDFVGHTNNTNYLKWAMDCEALNGGILHPGEVTVNFIHEISAGEVISFRRICSSGLSFLIGTVNGRTVMTARLAH